MARELRGPFHGSPEPLQLARVRVGIPESLDGNRVFADDGESATVVDAQGDTPVMTDGPYLETKEVIGGFVVLDLPSRDEALEWAARFASALAQKPLTSILRPVAAFALMCNSPSSWVTVHSRSGAMPSAVA